MDEVSALFAWTLKATLALAALVSGLAGLFFKDWQVFAGVWIGALMSIAGLYAIVGYTRSLTTDTASKIRALLNYSVRYLFYGAVMLLAAFAGIPVLSLLAGFLCGKLALIYYSFKIRKEEEDGNS